MKKVLLVDDDPLALGIYSKQLKRLGYAVDISNSASKTLEKLAASAPDLLILDLNLGYGPGPEDGFKVLREIRQNPRTKDLKVIVVSNYRESDYPELSNLKKMGVLRTIFKAESTPQEIAEAAEEVLK